MKNDLTTRTESLLETCAKATPGEWEWTGEEVSDDAMACDMGRITVGESSVCWFGQSIAYDSAAGDPPNDEDAASIIRLHNEAPDLLREWHGWAAEHERKEKERAVALQEYADKWETCDDRRAELEARVAFLESALGEAKAAFWIRLEDGHVTPHDPTPVESEKVPNLTKWLQEGE